MISYISKRHSDFAISQGFYFHETSEMRSFSNTNPRENYRIYITCNMVVIVIITLLGKQ